ncbi:MAG: protein kinase [Chloroflexi bacterium]|nr:protein kinase [Chloroflexota bacterium]
MAFAPGDVVGSYRIIECIGQGGMATIYRAHQESLDRDVALKVIHPALMNDESFRIRLNREASIVAKLNHPNIIPIYDYGQSNGIPFLVMRYVEGNTLKGLLKERRLETGRILEIAHSVGGALAYAHSHDVLHRDVKPSNILIDLEGNVFLGDFGLARLTYSGETTASRDMLIGSPYYISPEQAKGDSVDARSDIYSFGIVLFEMFTGNVPFSCDTPYATVLAHINDPLPCARTFNPEAPLPVEKVLEKALAKDREDRYATVDQMLLALENALSGPRSEDPAIVDLQVANAELLLADKVAEPTIPIVSAEPVIAQSPLVPEPTPLDTSSPEPADSRFVKGPDFSEGGQSSSETALRKRLPHIPEEWRLAGIAFGILILFVILIVAPNMQSTPPREDRPLVYLPTLTPTATPSPVSFAPPIAKANAAVRNSPVAKSATTERHAAPLLPKLSAMPAAPPALASALDPSSGTIAYSVALGDQADLHSIWIVNANGSDPHKVADMALWPSLSPDSTRIAYYRIKDSGIYVANADGVDAHKVLGFADTCCVQWSPDSKRLLYFRGNLKFGGKIFSANADGTDIAEITSGFNPAWAPDGSRIAYASCETNSSQCGLYIYDLKKAATTMITRDNGANPQWSPNGDKIVYQADNGHSHLNVFVVNADGTGSKQITSGQGDDGQPTWSRDGNTIFWRSDRNGTGWAVFAMRPDGSNARLVLSNTPPDPNLWGRESLSAGP